MAFRRVAVVLGVGLAVSAWILPAGVATAQQPPTASTPTQTTSLYTNASTWTATGGASDTVISECTTPSWTATVPNGNAKWIWVNDTNPGCPAHPGNAPLETVDFSTSFNVPGAPEHTTLNVAVDNTAEIYVNGQDVGPVVGFATSTPVDITSSLIADATNTLSIVATNAVNPGCLGTMCNPAGVLASVDVTSDLSNTSYCKADGWRQWANPTFNNQGDCVSYVVSHSPQSS